MNILYFVEPRQELGNPLFRLGTIRNHVSKEIVELKKTTPSTTDVRLLTSTQVAKSALSEGLLDGVVLHTINQSIIEKKFPDSKAAASAWYTGAYTLNDEKVMQRLCRKSLGKFVPDIIICYESAAPYLKTLFPKAAFLNSMLGIFSRAPYPETGCFDPFGIYADSYIRKFASELLALKIDTKQSQMLTRLREKYSKFIDSNNPIRAQDIRGNYNKVLLVPLQVTGYFAFDDNLPENSDINNQLQLIKSILESVDSSVGVYVTLHGAEADVMTNGIIESLQSEYPNLLYNENIQKIRWSSQWILPYVDGVATVSSSVGLQSLFWKKPIFIIGHSHLATFNAGELESAHNILEQESDFDGALYHLLTKYYPLMSNKVQDGHWLYSFFLKAVEKHRSGEIGFDYFETQSNSDEEVFENFLSGIQTVQTLKDLKKHTSHMTPTNLVNVNEIKYQINNHDVISFDIFDTLITRKLMHPNHVFDLMHKEATDVFEFEGLSIKQFGGFRSLRERAANRIIRQAKSDNVEEISFNAIYEEMRKLTGLSKRAILVLRKLELKTEKDVTSIRQLGYDLYSYAQSLGKKVIFVSDMYLNSKDIEFLVKQNGYTNYQKCYVSSKYNKLKKSGSLFEVVKADHPGQSILHMGDNHLADVLKAVEAGLTAYHLPLISQTYMASLIAKDIFSKSEVDDCLGSSLMHGVISRKFYDNHINELDWFNGSPYRMGFEACGPILLGFTKWILEQAIRDGVEDLYFLARDGYLIKDIYDKISVNISNAPKSHYLLASRRCYNTANLKTEQDIFDSLSLTFSRTPLHKIMEARYGISLQEIDKTTIKQAGLTSVNDVIDIKIRS
ncbi:MAG: FMN phosphatase YigB (HAD superfamily), partial [Halieaceae bacterium]